MINRLLFALDQRLAYLERLQGWVPMPPSAQLLRLQIKQASNNIISWPPLELNCIQDGHRWVPSADEWEICATCGVSRSIAHRR